MKKKWMDFVFCILFLLLITIPLLKFDTTEVIDSELENRRLTMWPGFGFNQKINEWYGHYAEDRVGFRKEAVQFYMDATYFLFDEFSEDLHMYGKEGHIFPADEAYIRAYQHLATDEELIDSLVLYLKRTDQYLEQKGITFVFMAGLDKKSVYGEYMPDYIHVDQSKESILEMLARKLSDAKVSYVIPVSEFQKAKKEQLIYNYRYDCAHWNALGTMEGLKILNKKIRETNPEVPLLSEDAFDLSYEEKNIEFISLPVKDRIPVFQLKEKYAASIINDTKLAGELTHVNGTSVQHYQNDSAMCEDTILILQDSFLENNAQYFSYRYRNVYLISRQNYEHMQYYVEQLKPDIVVFENAERAFVDDLYAYTNLANITYEVNKDE